MSIKITTNKGKFFFSGSISLKPLQSTSKEIENMTDTEMQDVIEGHDIKSLRVEGIEALREEYKKRTTKQIINTTIVNDSELKPRVIQLENDFNNLTLGVVESKVMWSTTEW